jgi:hypothetical protein
MAVARGTATLSNRTVRSAWKVFHWRQERKMTSAATGRPLWKPRSSADTGHQHSLSIKGPHLDLTYSHHPHCVTDWKR